MNKLEVLQTFRRSAEEACYADVRERYEIVVTNLLHGRSLWKDYGWYVGVLQHHDRNLACKLNPSVTRMMRKHYRKILATIACALCDLGEWKQQQNSDRKAGKPS
jgi:hypothetical protein